MTSNAGVGGSDIRKSYNANPLTGKSKPAIGSKPNMSMDVSHGPKDFAPNNMKISHNTSTNAVKGNGKYSLNASLSK